MADREYSDNYAEQELEYEARERQRIEEEKKAQERRSENEESKSSNITASSSHEYKKSTVKNYRESDQEKYTNSLNNKEANVFSRHTDGDKASDSQDIHHEEEKKAEEAQRFQAFINNLEDADNESSAFQNNESSTETVNNDVYFNNNNHDGFTDNDDSGASGESSASGYSDDPYENTATESEPSRPVDDYFTQSMMAEELEKKAGSNNGLTSGYRNDTFHINGNNTEDKEDNTNNSLAGAGNTLGATASEASRSMPGKTNNMPYNTPERPNAGDIQAYGTFKNRSKHSISGIYRQAKMMAIAATRFNDTDSGKGYQYLKQQSDIFKSGFLLTTSILPQTLPFNPIDRYVDDFFKDSAQVAANLRELTGGQMSEWNPEALEKILGGKYRVREGFVGKSLRLNKASGKFLTAEDLFRLDGAEMSFAIEHLGTDGQWHMGLSRNDKTLLKVRERMGAKKGHSLLKMRIKNIKTVGHEAKQLFLSAMRGSEMSDGMGQISQWKRGIKTVLKANKHFYNLVVNKPLEKLTGHSLRTGYRSIKNTTKNALKKPFKAAGKWAGKGIKKVGIKVGNKIGRFFAKRLTNSQIRTIKTVGRRIGRSAKAVARVGNFALKVVNAPVNLVKALTKAATEAIKQGVLAIMRTIAQLLSQLASSIAAALAPFLPLIIGVAVIVMMVVGLSVLPEGSTAMVEVCEAIGAKDLDPSNIADDTITNTGREAQMIQIISNMRTKSPGEYLFDFDTRGGSDIVTHDPDRTLDISQGTWGAPNRTVETNGADDDDGGDETGSTEAPPDGTYVNFYNGNYTKRDPENDFLVNGYDSIADDDVKNTAHTRKFYNLSFKHNRMEQYMSADKNNAIPYYSNLKEIISTMSVALEFDWSDSWDYNSVVTYAHELWESTHDAYVETSKVYQCNEADFSNQTSRQEYVGPSSATGAYMGGDDNNGTILTYGHGCKRAIFSANDFTSSTYEGTLNKLKKMLEYKAPAPEGGKSDEIYDSCVLFYNRFADKITKDPNGKWHIGWYYHHERRQTGSHQDANGNTIPDYTWYTWYTFGPNDDEKVAVAYCPGHVNLMVNVMIAGMCENNDCLLVEGSELKSITEDMLEDTMFDQHDDPSTPKNDSYSPYPVLVLSEQGRTRREAEGDQENHFSTTKGWKNPFDKPGQDDYEAVAMAISKYQDLTMEEFKEANGLDLRDYIYDGRFWMTEEELRESQERGREGWENTLPPTVSGNYSTYADALIAQAASAVGRIPYYWGGAYSFPDFEGNNFGTICSPDNKGRTHKGLDCSAFCSWVYYSVGCHMSDFSNALIAQTGSTWRQKYSTGSLPSVGSFVVGQSSNWPALSPGDIIFVKQENGQYGHAMIFESYDGVTQADGTIHGNGKAWIYQEGGQEQNVNHRCKNLLGIYNGRRMYYLHIGNNNN